MTWTGGYLGRIYHLPWNSEFRLAEEEQIPTPHTYSSADITSGFKQTKLFHLLSCEVTMREGVCGRLQQQASIAFSPCN